MQYSPVELDDHLLVFSYMRGSYASIARCARQLYKVLVFSYMRLSSTTVSKCVEEFVRQMQGGKKG